MRYDILLSKANVTVGTKTSVPTVEQFTAALDLVKDATRKAIEEIIPTKDDIKEIVSSNVNNVSVDEATLGKLIDSAVAKNIPVKVEASTNVELTDKVNQMMTIMKELSERDNSAPSKFDSYALNDDEIANVLTWLLEFQDKYFPSTPLSETLHQDFMWNIPKEVYDAAIDARDYGYPDVLNPIFWFYIFCTESPHDMIGEFIINAVNTIDDDTERFLADHAKEYRKAYFENESEEEDIDSDDLYSISVETPENGIMINTNPVPLSEPNTSSIEDFDSEVDTEVIQ